MHANGCARVCELVLKRTYSLQEDGEDDENADGHETGSETEVGEEEDAGDLPDLPELSGHSRPDAVRRHSSPIRPRPKLPSRRKTRMSERWTRSEKLERRDSLRSDSMQLGDSVNVNELMLKVYDTHHDTPLGDFIRGGIPSTRLFEGWLKSKGSTFGLQLLDLLVRNARNDGPAFDEDAAPCDCRLVDVCGNVAVTKGWKSKYALFEALKQGSRRALDDQNMFFSEFRPQRTLQIWNLTPEHAGILCSEGHILYNPYIDSFLSSHLGFNNTFELRVSVADIHRDNQLANRLCRILYPVAYTSRTILPTLLSAMAGSPRHPAQIPALCEEAATSHPTGHRHSSTNPDDRFPLMFQY